MWNSAIIKTYFFIYFLILSFQNRKPPAGKLFPMAGGFFHNMPGEQLSVSAIFRPSVHNKKYTAEGYPGIPDKLPLETRPDNASAVPD